MSIEGKVLYDFNSGGGSELTVYADELVKVLRQDIGEGWWEVQRTNAEQGLVPEAYIEVVSMPEPKIPPPPPPGQMAAPVPARNSRPATLQSQNSWNAPPQKPPQPQPQQSWRTPSTPAETGGYDNHGGVGGGGSGGGGGGLRNQDSYDDWEDDDDWDDDDSSTTTEQHQGFNDDNHYNSRSRSSKEDKKFGTVSKKFNRFSSFNKHGGEQYLFGSTSSSLSDADKKVTVMDTLEGPFWKPHDQPFTCQIANPKKDSKFHGMKSFIAYQVIPTFSNIQVSRRYKHFDWLHERLCDNYPSICVPPLPDKQIAGRYEDDFINERMRQLQFWMDRMCRHPTIAQSECLQHFLTCTDDKKWKQGKRRAEKNEFQGSKFFLTVATPNMPLEQKIVDQQLERFTRFLKSMDDSVKHLFAVGESSVRKHQGPFRKEFQKLGSSFSSVSKSFEFDQRPAALNLTHAIEHTGTTYEELSTMYEQQPKNDLFPLLEGLQEYKGILSVFPDVVSVQRAASTKMEESYAKLTDNEAQAAHGRLEVISYTTLAEINHFNQYRVGDFKLIMQRYLQAQINFHENIASKLKETLRQYDNA